MQRRERRHLRVGAARRRTRARARPRSSPPCRAARGTASPPQAARIVGGAHIASCSVMQTPSRPRACAARTSASGVSALHGEYTCVWQWRSMSIGAGSDAAPYCQPWRAPRVMPSGPTGQLKPSFIAVVDVLRAGDALFEHLARLGDHREVDAVGDEAVLAGRVLHPDRHLLEALRDRAPAVSIVSFDVSGA